MCAQWADDVVVQRLREYLRIPSVHPDVDYDDCVTFLKEQANQLDVPVVVYEFVPRKPVVILTWEGLEPGLPSILLNSHMDVVPVYEEKWTYPPFEAYLSEDGFIYARGSQDMKSVGMTHLEAVRRLKDARVRLKRTVHISFVPDEEIGGVDGMKKFSESVEFKKLNIGFELDEGGPHENPDELFAFYGERTCRQIKVTCRGSPSHGCLSLPGTAGEKFHKIIDKFMTLGAQEQKKLDDTKGWLGDITTINLTQVEGGLQVNILPESLSVSFDIRIATDVDHQEFEDTIERWCQESGDGVTYEYLVKNPQVENTKIDGCVPFWNMLHKTVTDMGIKMNCHICPGTTDARYVRAQGIPAINFTPFTNTPLLIHAHDETLNVDVYKRGIDIMEKVLEAVANI